MGSERDWVFFCPNSGMLTVIVACGLEALTDDWEEEEEEEEEDEKWGEDSEGDQDVRISQDEVQLYSNAVCSATV